MPRVSLLHEPSALAPLNKIVLGEQSGLSRCAYVVANFLLPRFQTSRSGLTQALVKLGCQIPKQIHSNAFQHEPSPVGGLPRAKEKSGRTPIVDVHSTRAL
jgi:hypothetical protein